MGMAFLTNSHGDTQSWYPRRRIHVRIGILPLKKVAGTGPLPPH
jgi:hypothetical protein